MSVDVQVAGKCPMGCGETLELNISTGEIRCTDEECPRQSAVTDLLKDPPIDHTVEIAYTGFAIKHPLHERIEDKLFDCDLQRWLEDLEGAPVSNGLYRVTKVEPALDDLPFDAVVIEGWMFQIFEIGEVL